MYTMSFLRCAFTDVTDVADARCFTCRKKERKKHLYIDDEDECDLVCIAYAYTWVRIHSKVSRTYITFIPSFLTERTKYQQSISLN